MLRRICASLMLCAFLLQTGATVYACTRIGGTAAHADHVAMATESTSPHTTERAAQAGVDRKRVASAEAESMPEHCNRFHRADCPHRGAAFHPCPSDQLAGLQALDAGLPVAPEAIVFGLDGLTASTEPIAPSTPTRALSPDLPPPRTV